MFLAPAVSPKRTTTSPNNPGLRLYKFNTNTGKVLDYMQLYLDLKVSASHRASRSSDSLPVSLQATHNRGAAVWEVEYNFTQYYRLNEISASSLHSLVESFTSDDSELFARYAPSAFGRLQTALICPSLSAGTSELIPYDISRRLRTATASLTVCITTSARSRGWTTTTSRGASRRRRVPSPRPSPS